MIIVYIISLLSFFLESIMSKILSSNLLFCLVTLVISYPFFKNEDNKYYIYSFIFGLSYDLVYTDTFLFNAFLFLLVSILIKNINLHFSNNPISVLIFSFISILTYKILSFFSLVIVGYLEFSFNVLKTAIKDSLLINLVYVLLAYLITDYFSKKYRILKID